MKEPGNSNLHERKDTKPFVRKPKKNPACPLLLPVAQHGISAIVVTFTGEWMIPHATRQQ